MAPFMLIGAVGGLVGAIVNRGVLRVAKLRKTTFLKRYPVSHGICLDSLRCIVALLLPRTGDLGDHVGPRLRPCFCQELGCAQRAVWVPV